MPVFKAKLTVQALGLASLKVQFLVVKATIAFIPQAV
jgi:hypothetical protein